jgi:HEAT repeat protein
MTCRLPSPGRAWSRAAWALRPVAATACLAAAGCASSVNDILQEAKRGDPESVRAAVVELGQVLAAKEQAGYPYDEGDEEAIRYLEDVARSSSDPLNRGRAVSSLALLKRPRLTSLYVAALDDASWLVQMEAARALEWNPDPGASTALARRLGEENRMEVRLLLLRAIQACGGEVALKALLEAFLDGSSKFRNLKLTVYDGVRKLSGKSFEFEDLAGWRGFYEERFPVEKHVPEAPAAGGSPGGAS